MYVILIGRYFTPIDLSACAFYVCLAVIFYIMKRLRDIIKLPLTILIVWPKLAKTYIAWNVTVAFFCLSRPMIQKIPLGSAWMVNAAFLFATMSILVKNAATNLHMNEDELAFWRSLLPALVIFGTTLARKKTLKTPFFGVICSAV